MKVLVATLLLLCSLAAAAEQYVEDGVFRVHYAAVNTTGPGAVKMCSHIVMPLPQSMAAGADVTCAVSGGADSLALIARVDGSFVGETWFHPVQEERLPNLFGYFGFGQGEFSKQVRDPYTVINLRLTLQGDNKLSVAGTQLQKLGQNASIEQAMPVLRQARKVSGPPNINVTLALTKTSDPKEITRMFSEY